MSDDLLSLRLVVVSHSAEDHELFRLAAASAAMPIDVVTADSAAAARGKLSGADLLYLDAGLSPDDIRTTLAAARSARNPPFTVQLSGLRRGAQPFETDAIADKPERLEEATGLINRSMRVRLPNWVLVVDDSSTMRNIVRKLIAGVRFPLQVCEAGEGFAALKMVRDHAIDLVFMDYNMPGFSGLETVAEFKREKQRVHVVLMTSVADPSLEVRASEAGVGFLKSRSILPISKRHCAGSMGCVRSILNALRARSGKSGYRISGKITLRAKSRRLIAATAPRRIRRCGCGR